MLLSSLRLGCALLLLQVWVYEEADERGEGNLYVHHTVMLPAFPLSVAWLDCDPGGRVSSHKALPMNIA